MSATDPAADIVNVRRFAWPREEVFRAFSDPSRLARWWGPKGFTNEFHVFEFRPGGKWQFTMRAPDGGSFAMDKVFTEVVPPARIVVDHAQAGHDFTLTISLAETSGGTEMTWRMRFADPAEGTRLRAFLLQANEENLDRLQAHLAERVSGTGQPVR